MKHTKICPKCECREIYHVEAVVGHTYGAGNVIPTGVIETIKVNRYICVNFFPAIILLTF